MDEQKPRELTTQQAAELAGVSTAYIRMLLSNGTLQGRKPSGWVWFVNRASLERWMAERKPRTHRAGDG